jgi:hypothetical protein
MTDMLSDRAKELLDLEDRYPGMTGRKLYLVHEMSGSPARHFQELNALIDDPDALRERPILVKRLLRQRAQRLVRRRAMEGEGSHGSPFTHRNGF